MHRMSVQLRTPARCWPWKTWYVSRPAPTGSTCDHGVAEYAVSLVLATREPVAFGLPELAQYLAFGASPRASLGLVKGARALALLRGRSYALPQDVFDIAPDVLRHRLVLSYEALAQGLTEEHLLARLLSTVPAPRVSPTQDPASQTHGHQAPHSQSTPSGQAAPHDQERGPQVYGPTQTHDPAGPTGPVGEQQLAARQHGGAQR